MAQNYFKILRKSYIASTFLTTLMSNLLIFGQPIQQMAAQMDHFEQVTLKKSNGSEISLTTKEYTNSSSPTSHTFYAKEKKGVIGKMIASDRENPRDNFFTVEIPDNLQLDKYQAKISYDLYGLTHASQTTKSINNTSSYGGMLLTKNKSWNAVSEYISIADLKTGKNEVYFTRRADETYQYKIKNFRLELLKKEKEVVLSEPVLKNFNGNVYISGLSSNPSIKQLKIGEKLISVNNGIFEGVLENISKKTKQLEITYTIGNQEHSLLANVSFQDTKTKTIAHSYINDSKNNHSFSYATLEKRLQHFEALGIDLSKKFKNKKLGLAGEVSINGLNFKDLKSVSEEIENVTDGDFLGYRLKKNNIDDSIPLLLHLKYDPAKIPSGYTPKDVKTFYFDHQHKNWKALPIDSLDVKNQTVITTVTQDTDYINGVIKVPENPETSSFVPTAMNDIEFANPAAGVVSIAPPAANNMGTVNTSFPIKLPKGRNGMQPSLSVSYNSEGGNGWMGLGWNINIPAITLNTKWGVPAFNVTHESELYSLNGEELVLKNNGTYTNPHRTDNISRVSNRTFYLRKEGSYLKITRKGTATSNYSWIVEDKFGNKSYYGGINSASNAYVIKDNGNSGNIVYWALLKQQDRYGNFTEYFYTKDTNSYGFNTFGQIIQGTEFYIDRIEYTKKGTSTSNFYTVKFNRDSSGRPDVVVNARNGFIQHTKDLLNEIKISFNSQTIRSYEFSYKTSNFQKSLLDKIAEYDKGGNLFYSNTIEYYDNANPNSIISSSPNSWNGNSDQISSPLHDIATGGVGSLIPKGSALGTSTSDGFSVGLRGGFGIGLNPTSVNTTVGGSVNYSQSNQDGRISFIDMNGDGLVDKVFNNNNHIYYRPNTGNSFENSIEISGINRLSKTKSRTTGWGLDANALGLIGVGKSESTTKSRTDYYFTDFNGDGLPDMVGGNHVKFNITQAGADYSWRTFDDSPNESENLISSGVISSELIQNLDLDSEEELRAQFPQFDHVKVWRAPYDGNISISGQARLWQENNCNDNPNNFRLTVERQNAQGISIVGNQESLNAPSIGYKTINRGITNLKKGDLVFFRIHNTEYGCGGEIEWNPQITYSIIDEDNDFVDTWPNSDLNLIDENNKSIKTYNAKNDYIVSGGEWSPDKNDTQVQLNFNLSNSNFSALQFSDDIDFIIKKIALDPIDGSMIQETTWKRTYQASSGNFPTTTDPNQFNTSLSSSYNYVFRFTAESDSNVAWDNIQWDPEASGLNSGLNFPQVNYVSYNDNTNQKKYWYHSNELVSPIISNDGQDLLLKIKHTMFSQNYEIFLNQFSDEEFPLKIHWVTKEKTPGSPAKVLYKKTFFLQRLNQYPFGNWNYNFYNDEQLTSVVNSVSGYHQFFLSKDKVETIYDNNGTIFSSFNVGNKRFALGNGADIILELHQDEAQYYPTFSSTTLSSPFLASTPAFYGLPYRGWGEFLYNGGLSITYDDDENITGTEYFDGIIDPDVFPDPEELDDQSEIDDLQDQINEENPEDAGITESAIRYTLYEQQNNQNRYLNTGIKDAIYGFTAHNGQQLLTSTIGRFGEADIYDIYIDEADITTNENGFFVGLNQRSKSKGKAKSGNLGGDITGGASLNGTFSYAESNVLNQYIDLNGDRYPDMVTKGNIQYTNMLGGLSDDPNFVPDNDFVAGSKSSDETVGVSISGLQANSTASSNNQVTGNQTRTNVNSGINSSSGKSFDERLWIDLNGDGLTDKVRVKETEITVQLNTGYSFTDEMSWGVGYSGTFLTSERTNSSIGPSFNFNSSFAAGFGASTSVANSNVTFIDVNGDGLPDLVRKVGYYYKYYLNTGLGFLPETQGKNFFNSSIEENKSVAGNLFGSYTNGFTIPILFIVLKATFSVSGGVNGSFNETTTAVRDINGDGYPDVLHKKNNNSSVNANLNQMGKTHLLKKVNTPLGGSWTVDYKRNGNTYDMPQNKWVMSELKSNDGFNGDSNFGSNETLTTFAYENGKYDRRDRSSYGFASVKAEQHYPSDPDGDPYRYTIKKYHNQNYYLQGMVKETASYKANGDLLSKSKNYYNMLNPELPLIESNVGLDEEYQQSSTGELDRTRLFPVIVKTISTNYENGNALNLVKEFEAYDNQGNLTKYIDWGTGGQDAYRTEISYGINNFPGLPTNIKVKDLSGTVLRDRDASYNGYGKLNIVTVHLGNGQTNRIQLGYDTYGNTTSVKQLDNLGPAGAFTQNISYDPVVHTYPTNFSDSFNQTSSAQYNYLFGIPVLTTDMNGKKIRTRIDNRGRIIEVTAPNEMEDGAWNDWTIRNIYQGEEQIISQLDNAGTETYLIDYAAGSFPAIPAGNSQPTNSQHYAITKHAVMDAYNDELLTISIADGFGKAVQLKKSHYTNGGMVWLVGGYEKKDSFGRVVKSYLSANQGGYTTLSTSKTYYAPNLSNFLTPVEMVYDEKDRKTKITQPNESESTNITYEINNNRLLTTVENENNQTNTTYTDVRGRKTKTIQNGEITTNFYYNRINELIRVKNTQGYNTKYEYDKAGRRTREVHPDRGVATFKYNKIGSVIEKKTSNLFQQGSLGPITYDYTYNRLTNINYPNRQENNVEYVYGTQAQPGTNGIGRLILQKDATGIQSFQYGNLGELTLNARAIAVAGRTSYWYISKWEYDSWNRVQKITYPDQEEVIYNYDPAGQLQSISSDIPGVNSDDIVADIAYNKYGERERIMYGNGTESIYQYDSRRRLDILSQNFTNFQVQKQYQYDPLSNIIEIATLENSSILPTSGELGGPTYHSYKYDDFNRLKDAEGFYIGPNDLAPSLLRQNYSLGMEYDEAHNIIQKLQTHQQGTVTNLNGELQQPEVMGNTDYKLKYDDYASGSYSVDGESYVQPHAPRTITQYPSNSDDPNDTRTKKQLIEYDANGNMTAIKEEITDPEEPIGYREITLKQNLWDEENRLNAVDLNPEAPENKPEVAAYTYDANGERIIKYLPARLDAYYSAEAAGSKARMEAVMYPSPLLTVKTLPLPKGITSYQMARMTITKYTKHYYIGSERISSALGTLPSLGILCQANSPGQALIEEVNLKLQQAEVAIGKDFISFDKQENLPPTLPTQIARACGKAHDDSKYDAYWYHPDHLGSSSYITNRDGNISQHMEYLPFGETLVEEHLNSYNSPYKFNAKELDEETGWYYYGARYYNPKWSIWLSVDPLAETTMQPYSAFNNNPVFYTDPTGMIAEPPGDYYDKQGNWLYNDGIDDNKVYEVSQAPGVSSDIEGSGALNVEYVGQVENVKMTFTGEANSENTKQADGQLNVIQEVSNGKDYTRSSFDAVGGPWGNGSPENGDYSVNTLLDRGPKGWYNKGMTKDGIGFSLNVDPQFKTGRSLLRIHPDGGKYFGTQGCIGLTCGKSGLTNFKGLMQNTLSTQDNIPLNINILNNPNNNGYGKKTKSNGE
ncbi:toxin TcdB middle/N-terminal domain-containing protein [Mesonia ostreae]|uniref:Toxin TcdB middle/N-terminal domain-containing protein n=1 Tax=Mesonia ostreae TaxID=861110 RepID=A0ABU2KJR0_9FLAO|nr:toxin TcdB middle/N-terminal domain-containing protein [Mesonia ostreae]MDT0294909.1 toxin TcdB middle/N-terminal domain-containing protein [Mesonia ostreae]